MKGRRKFRRRTLIQLLGKKGWVNPEPTHEWERHCLLRDIRSAITAAEAGISIGGGWKPNEDGVVTFTAHDIRTAYPGAYTGDNYGRIRPRSKELEEALERLHRDGSLHRSGGKRIPVWGRRMGFAAQSYCLNPVREEARKAA